MCLGPPVFNAEYIFERITVVYVCLSVRLSVSLGSPTIETVMWLWAKYNRVLPRIMLVVVKLWVKM